MIRKRLIQLSSMMVLSAMLLVPCSAASAYEGNGYASPEEAVSAYLQAFSEQDYEGMVSTFAVESFVSNMNVKEMIKAQKEYSFRDILYFPDSTDFTRQMNIQSRLLNINSMQTGMYCQLIAPELDMSKPYFLGPEISREEFTQQYFGDGSFMDQFIWNGDFIEPEKVLGSKADACEAALKAQQGMYGAEDLRSCIAEFQVENEKWLLLADTICYGDTWYLLDIPGTAGQKKDAFDISFIRKADTLSDHGEGMEEE